MRLILALVTLLTLSLCWGRPPKWTKEKHRDKNYPTSEYFRFYVEQNCGNTSNCETIVRSAVMKGLIESILVNITSATETKTVALDGEVERRFEGQLLTSSELEIPELKVEYYEDDKDGYGFGFSYISREKFFDFCERKLKSTHQAFLEKANLTLKLPAEQQWTSFFKQVDGLEKPEDDFIRYYQLNTSLGNVDILSENSYSSYQAKKNELIKILGDFRISGVSHIDIVPFRAWGPHNVSVSYRDQPLPQIPLYFTQRGKLLAQRSTGQSGELIIDKKMLPELEDSLLSVSPVQNPNFRDFVQKEISVNYTPALVYIRNQESNLGEPMLNEMLREAIIGAIESLGQIEITDDQQKADLILQLKAKTRQGDEGYGRFTTYLDASASLRDKQKQEYWNQTIDGQKGVGGSYIKAGLNAYQKGAEAISSSLRSFIESY